MVAWSLKKAKYFVSGCDKSILAVKHKPLLGILNEKNLEDIDNTRCQYPTVVPEELELEEEDRLTRIVVRSIILKPEKSDQRESNDLESDVKATIRGNLQISGGTKRDCIVIDITDVRMT